MDKKEALITSLTKLYNTLFLISTKGEDTLYMAECLSVLRNIISFLSIEEKSYTQTIEIPKEEEEKENG